MLGVEGDLMAADINGSQHFNSGFKQVNPSIDAMADLRLRAGCRRAAASASVRHLRRSLGQCRSAGHRPGWRALAARVLRLERRRRRRSRFGTELGARFDYQFTDFNSETVNYPAALIDYDPDDSIYRGSLIYRF